MKKYKEFIILIIFTMGTQALIYFLLKSFIHDYNILNPVISIPLIKPFIYIYNIWYLFIFTVALLIYKNDKSIFKCLITTMLFGALLAHITYIIYPTMITRPSIEVNNLTDFILYLTYKYDTPAINCLPSMHCTYCFIVIFYISICKNINYKGKIFIVLFSLLIVLSTLFTKQHIVIDILIAFVYSVLAIIIVKLNQKRIIKLFNKLKFLN